MATILPFPAPRGGDWTAGERAGLDELATRLAGEARVEVAFGRSDSGDPWCVVLDAHDEVLVHVAREGTSFVAHTADDLFVKATDLRTAVERVLGSRWHEERADVVVPFAAAGRSAQVVTAVLVVASFVHHYRAEAEPAEDWSFAAARPLKPAQPREGRDEAAKVAAAIDALPGAEPHLGALPPPQSKEAVALPFAAPDPLDIDAPLIVRAEPAAPAPGVALAVQLIAASATITGSDGAEMLVGGGGDDLLDAGSAPPRTHDLLDGGAGDDRLMIDDGTVAIGGPGGDSFVIRAPATPDAASLLGVLVDFDPGADAIVAATPGGSTTVTVVSSAPLPDILAGLGGNFAALPALPGHRLGVDLDGDGIADGHLLVNGLIPEPAVVEAVRQAFSPVDAAPPPAAFLPAEAVMIAPPITPEPLAAALPELI